eukprot:8053958-Alexandrium_andersonii.AAC.1
MHMRHAREREAASSPPADTACPADLGGYDGSAIRAALGTCAHHDACECTLLPPTKPRRCTAPSSGKQLEDVLRNAIPGKGRRSGRDREARDVGEAVSYTHLTLPTICSV